MWGINSGGGLLKPRPLEDVELAAFPPASVLVTAEGGGRGQCPHKAGQERIRLEAEAKRQSALDTANSDRKVWGGWLFFCG